MLLTDSMAQIVMISSLHLYLQPVRREPENEAILELCTIPGNSANKMPHEEAIGNIMQTG